MKLLCMILLSVLFTALVMACSANSAQTVKYTTPEASPESFDFSRCEPLETVFSVDVGSYLKGSDQGLRAVYGFQSPDDPSIWFVAADVEGPGNEGAGPVAMWWMRSQSASRPIPVSISPLGSTTDMFDDIGYDYISLSDPEVLGQLPTGIKGADYAEECTLNALRQDPGMLTGQELVQPGRWLLNIFGAPSLIASVEARVKDCDQLIFYLPDRGTPGAEFKLETDAQGRPAINDTFNTEGCSTDLVMDLSELPPIDMDTIPAEYRQLIDKVYGRVN